MIEEFDKLHVIPMKTGFSGRVDESRQHHLVECIGGVEKRKLRLKALFDYAKLMIVFSFHHIFTPKGNTYEY